MEGTGCLLGIGRETLNGKGEEIQWAGIKLHHSSLELIEVERTIRRRDVTTQGWSESFTL